MFHEITVTGICYYIRIFFFKDNLEPVFLEQSESLDPVLWIQVGLVKKTYSYFTKLKSVFRTIIQIL